MLSLYVTHLKLSHLHLEISSSSKIFHAATRLDSYIVEPQLIPGRACVATEQCNQGGS